MTNPDLTRPDWQIHVVDDDASFRRSLAFLLDSMGWPAHVHASAAQYLEQGLAEQARTGCLLLDVRMPDMSGLELQQRLLAAGYAPPIVFLTGHGDVELAVQAMKRGAFDFMEKPFRDQRLIDVVAAALRRREHALAAEQQVQQADQRLARLSPREAEVAHLLALGLSNKAIARELAISDKTVHVHRQHVRQKTGAESAAELARLMLRADPHALDDGRR